MINPKADTTINARGFVQAQLDHQLGISGFGTLLHLSRLNYLHRSDFFAAFGLRFQKRDDLSKLLTFSPKRMSGLAMAAGLSQGITDQWSVDAWQPFVEKGLWDHVPWTLRACPSCLKYGYHSTLFQMPWIKKCPWHQDRLITHCRRCDRPLLMGFAEGEDLLQCVCGIDYVDDRAILKTDVVHANKRRAFLDDYWRWSRQSKTNALLIVPEEHDACGLTTLSKIIRPPEALPQWKKSFVPSQDAEIHVERYSRRGQESLSDADYQDFVRCAHSVWPGDPGMANVPNECVVSLQTIIHGIASYLPPDALTLRERKSFGLTDDGKKNLPTVSRKNFLFAPVQEVSQGNYLDVHVLHQTAYRVIANLAWQFLINDPARNRGESGSHTLVMKTLFRTLYRAYSDGLTHIFGRQIPALFDNSRLRSGPRLPWVLVQRDNVGVTSTSIAWSPRRPWDVITP